jgi:hypothetical protein
MLEQTYAGHNEPLLLYPSPTSRIHSIDSVLSQALWLTTPVVDDCPMAPDSDFGFPANGFQQYTDNPYSRNNSCYDQIAFLTSTHRNSTSASRDGQSSQLPPSTLAMVFSDSVHFEYYGPSTSSGIAPYSADHISSQFSPPTLHSSMKKSVDTTQWDDQPTVCETNHVVSPSSRGSFLRAMMTASDDENEPTPNHAKPPYTPQPDAKEITIGAYKTAPPREKAEPIPCGIEGCSKTFGGLFADGNRKRHIKNSHRGIQAYLPCYIGSCDCVYKREDSVRKHEWKKRKRLKSRPHKRGQNGIQVSFPCYIGECDRVYKREDARRMHEWNKHRLLESRLHKKRQEFKLGGLISSIEESE